MEDKSRTLPHDFLMPFLRVLFCISILELLNLWCPDPPWLRKDVEFLNPVTAGWGSALAGLPIRLSTPTTCRWVWGTRCSLLAAVCPQMGSQAKEHPMLDWATRGIRNAPILPSSLCSLTTGRTVWAARLQRTSNTWAKQSPLSKAAKCILNCRAELQASSAVAFISTPRSTRLPRWLLCWVRKRRTKVTHFFFLCVVAKSFSTFFTLSSFWAVWDWLLRTNPVSWLLKSHKRGKKAP